MRNVLSGDVLVVYDSTFPGWLIRFGAWLLGKPAKWNHVLVMSHMDDAGEWWAIEARPGGVNWTAGRDLRRYLSSPKTIDNARQPKTDTQRSMVVAAAAGMFEREYDWTAIFEDAAMAARIELLWKSRDYGDDPPAHVICSTLVAWLYRHVELDYPRAAQIRMRAIMPADWADFILRQHYDSKEI